MSAPKKEKWSEKTWSFTPAQFVLIMGLLLLVGYAGGTRNDQIVAAVGPAVGLKVEKGKLDFASVQNTFQQLKLNYDGDLDEQKLIEGASRGLVAAAGDPHTEYFTAEEAKKFDNELNGNIGGGIGAEIGMREDRPTILRTIDDTPAQQAGLQGGDAIALVNDQSVKDKTVDEVVGKIRGDIGTTVKLTVVRDGEVKEFTVTRQAITSPSVNTKAEGDVGVMTITRFDNKTGDSARAAAQELVQKGAKKIVLDLRDNGGGSLAAAPEVAGLWLSNKVIVSERQGGRTTDQQRSGSNALLAGMPTVILVNNGTASASEIVTAALKDHGAAQVIGEKTYGKGTVQTFVDLSSGAKIKVTIQRWYTPKGTNIDGKGIKPDQEVKLTKADADANRDTQFEAAKQYLEKR